MTTKYNIGTLNDTTLQRLGFSVDNNNITLNYHNIYNDILYSQNIICRGNYNNTNQVIKFCKIENDNREKNQKLC